MAAGSYVLVVNFDPAIDTAQLAAFRTRYGVAPVVPIFFAGQNSRLFQVASHISMTLRLSLLFKEVHDRIGEEMLIRIGKRIPYEELKAISDRKKLMEFLRDQTYALETMLPAKPKRKRRGRTPAA